MGGFSFGQIGGGAGFYVASPASGGGASLSFDFTGGVLPGGITFTRASIGTYTNNAGTLITASNDVARFNYIAGVANLLIEPSATNLALQSNAFSTSWTAVTATVASAQFISPDGTNNGWSHTNTASNGYVYEFPTYTAVPYTLSVWMKQISGGGSLIIGVQGGNSANFGTASLARYSFSRTPPAGAGIESLTNTGISGAVIGIYGAQLELGSVMTSYIPTTTVAVTRAADSATFTIPAGIGHLTFTFDDNTTQLVTVSAGSYTIPVTLNRPNIKSIVGSA